MGKYKQLEQSKRNKTRQEFLHTFFKGEKIDEVEEVNGFFLVKHWNGNSNTTEVAIYSKEAFVNREEGFNSISSMQKEFLERIERE